MTEEIIIDGCNVAECDCYDNTYCLWSKKYHEIRITPKCEIVKDCYFKQLQRAKADIAELKESNDWYDKVVNELLDVKAENEKLKSRNKLYKKIIVENQQKYHNRIMILKACIKGEINIDDFKNYAKLELENKKLKQKNKELKNNWG